MSDCDTGSFGYIEIEGDKLKVVFGDSSNPTIMRFCSTEYVKAIKEYPKLKEELDEVYKLCDFTQAVKLQDLLDENQKLKAENEELKQKYGGQISVVEVLTLDFLKINTEYQKLKQLREIIEDQDIQQVIQETIEDYYLSVLNLKLNKEVADSIVRKCEKLQQLLKGDSK